jgi:hypothetical protein
MALIPFIGRVLSHIDREVALVSQKSFCYLKCYPALLLSVAGNASAATAFFDSRERSPFPKRERPVLRSRDEHSWLKESAMNYVFLTAKSQKAVPRITRMGRIA